MYSPHERREDIIVTIQFRSIWHQAVVHNLEHVNIDPHFLYHPFNFISRNAPLHTWSSLLLRTTVAITHFCHLFTLLLRKYCIVVRLACFLLYIMRSTAVRIHMNAQHGEAGHVSKCKRRNSLLNNKLSSVVRSKVIYLDLRRGLLENSLFGTNAVRMLYLDDERFGNETETHSLTINMLQGRI